MKFKFAFKKFAVAASSVLFSSGILLANPNWINYQGLLRRNNVSFTGIANIEFQVYSSSIGGLPIWSSGPQPITVTRGNFNYFLGEHTASGDFNAINWNEERFLGIVIDNEVMSPRERFTSAARALNASRISGRTLSDLDGRYILTSGGALSGPLDFNKQEARHIVIHRAPEAPLSPVAGQLWYNTAQNRLRVFNGTIWEDAGGGAQLLLGSVTSHHILDGTITDVDISAAARILSTKIQLGTFTATLDYWRRPGTDLIDAEKIIGSGGVTPHTHLRTDITGVAVVQEHTSSQLIRPLSPNDITPLRIGGMLGGAADVFQVLDSHATSPQTAWVFTPAGHLETRAGFGGTKRNIVVSGDATVGQRATIEGTTADALTVGGGVRAGPGLVQIIGADGRITVLNATTLANLDGSALTGVIATSIADGAVTTPKLADGALAATAAGRLKMADGFVISRHILEGAVTSHHILDGTIGTADIALNAIISDRILDGTIATADIADSAVTTSKLAGHATLDDQRAVTTDHIRNLAVTTAKIADLNVTTGKLADGALLATAAGRLKMADGFVISRHILEGAVTSHHILDGTIRADDIADNAVVSLKIQDGAVTEPKIAASAVTTGKIADLAITTTKLADNVLSADFAGRGKMADGFVIAAKIADGAVTSAKILAGAVTSHHILDGTIDTADLRDAAVTEIKIGPLAVTEPKIAASAVTTGKIADLAVTTTKLAVGAITTDRIADGAVTSAKILAGAVTSHHILDGTIDTADLRDAAVTEIKIGPLAVTEPKIAASAVTTGKIADLAVTTTKLAVGAITTDRIADGALAATAAGRLKMADGFVTVAKIEDNAVTSPKILDGTIQAADLMNLAVTTEKIQVGAVTTDRIADDAVTALKLADHATLDDQRAVTTDHIRNLAVTTPKIADLAVTAPKIADGAITSAKILAGAVTSHHILDGTIDTADLRDAAVTEIKIGPLAVTEPKIAASAVTTGKIADLAVTTTKLAVGAITTDRIADGALAATAAGRLKMADGFVTVAKIEDNAVTSPKILDGTIQAADLMNLAVTTEKIQVGAVTTDRIADDAVTALKLADHATLDDQRAVTTDHIRNLAVTTAKIADLNVTTGKLADGAVTSAKILAGAVTSHHILDGTIGTADIALNAIISDRILDGTIATADIADSAVTTSKLAGHATLDDQRAVTTDHIRNLAVTTAKIADLNVTTGKLADGAVTNAKIAFVAVQTGNLADGAVTTVKLGNLAVTTDKINTLAVTEDKIAHGSISHIKLQPNIIFSTNVVDGAITTDKLAANVLSANIAGRGKMEDGFVTSVKIASGAVQTSNLADGAVTTDKLGNLAVTTDKIAAAAVTTEKVAPGAIKGDTLTSDIILSTHIADGEVKTVDLATNVLSANIAGRGKMEDGFVTSVKIASVAVQTGNLADGAVTTVKLGNLAVTTDKINTLAVTEDKIAHGSISHIKLQPNIIFSTNVVDGAITTDKLAANVLSANIAGRGKMEDGFVTDVKIATGAVRSHNIVDFTITADDLSAGSVTREKLNANVIALAPDTGRVRAITSTHFDTVDGSSITNVNASALDRGTLPDARLSATVERTNIAQTITAAKTYDANLIIGTGEIRAAAGSSGVTISTTAIITGRIQAGNGLVWLTNVAGNILPTSIAEGSLPSNVMASSIAVNAVHTDAIRNLAVTEAKLAADAVSTAKIQNLAVTGAKFADGAITSAKLTENVIFSTNIVDGAITSAKIRDNVITREKIMMTGVSGIPAISSTTGRIVGFMATTVDGRDASYLQNISSIAVDAVYTGAIRDNAVTTAKIADGAITSSDIADGSVTREKLNANIVAISTETGRVRAITSTHFDTVDGSSITNVNASALDRGTLPDARLSATVERTNIAQTITAAKTYDANLIIGTGEIRAAAGSSGVTISTSVFIGGGANIATVSGNVGIGVDAAAANRLNVRGAAGAANVLRLESDTAIALLVARNDGNVGINTTSPTHRLHVGGGIVATSSITAGSTLATGFYGHGGGITNIDVNNVGSGVLSADRGGTGIGGAGGTANRVLVTTNGTSWTAAQIAPATMIAAGVLASDVIVTSVAVNAVHADALRNNAVTDLKLAWHETNDSSRAVTSGHIRINAVTGEKIAAGAISLSKIDRATVDTVYITTGTIQSITGRKIFGGPDIIVTPVPPPTLVARVPGLRAASERDLIFAAGYENTNLEGVLRNIFSVAIGTVIVRAADLRLLPGISAWGENSNPTIWFNDDVNLYRSTWDVLRTDDQLEVGGGVINLVGAGAGYQRNNIPFDQIYVTTLTAQHISGRKTITTPAGTVNTDASLVVHPAAPHAGTAPNFLIAAGYENTAQSGYRNKFSVQIGTVTILGANLRLVDGSAFFGDNINPRIWFRDDVNLYNSETGVLRTDGAFHSQGTLTALNNAHVYGVFTSSVATTGHVAVPKGNDVIFDRVDPGGTANNTFVRLTGEEAAGVLEFVINGQVAARMRKD